MALNLNITTNSTATCGATRGNNIQPGIQEYYDKKLLKEMKPKLVHLQWAQKRPIPRNGGKTIRFRKYIPFDALTTPLTEGNPGDGQSLNMTDQTATVAQYGGYVAISDFLDMIHLDPVINDAVEQMADQGALTLDVIARETLSSGTNVIFANGTSRADVGAANKLTSVLLRKAVRTLKKNKAPMFTDGGRSHYIAIIGPDTTYDLQEDPSWVAVSQYQDKQNIYSGEIGMLYGVRVVETTEAKIFAGAGASSADVASTVVLGRDAYGSVDIGGSGAVKTIIKPMGSAGTADPLDQISTVGWKVPAFTVTRLMEDRMVRIEHGISA